MLNMIESWNALWTNISPKICGGKLNKAAGKRGRSRRQSAYALRRSRNTARAGRSPRSPRLPNCAVFWTARQMTFWGSGTELLSCRTLHRKNCSPAKGARVFRRAPPFDSCENTIFLPFPSSLPSAAPKGEAFGLCPAGSPDGAKGAKEDSTELPPRGSCCPTQGGMPACRSISTRRRTSPKGEASGSETEGVALS